LFLRGRFADVRECCIRETTAGIAGSAIAHDFQGGSFSLAVSSFVLCGADDTDCLGTVLINRDMDFNFSQLNFSECRLSTADPNNKARGYIFYTYASNATPWVFRYCTVLNNSGCGGIFERSGALGTVEYCNFYENSDNAHTAVLYCEVRGLSANYCIFYGNDRDFTAMSTSVKYNLTRCVFSDSPSPAYIDQTWSRDNVDSTTTASFLLSHLNTENCPTASPTSTLEFTPPLDLFFAARPRYRLIRASIFVWMAPAHYFS
jgi:hypothetical protein